MPRIGVCDVLLWDLADHAHVLFRKNVQMVGSLEVAFGKQGDYKVSPLPKRLHNSFNKLVETKGSADAEQIVKFLDELVAQTQRSTPKAVFFDSMHLKSKSAMGSRYRVRRTTTLHCAPLCATHSTLYLHRRCPSCSTRTETSPKLIPKRFRKCGKSSMMPRKRRKRTSP
jgi:hypothetical protein